MGLTSDSVPFFAGQNFTHIATQKVGRILQGQFAYSGYLDPEHTIELLPAELAVLVEIRQPTLITLDEKMDKIIDLLEKLTEVKDPFASGMP